MKIGLLVTTFFFFVSFSNAQNSSEIINEGDKNEFDISQTGTDSLNKSKIENKGEQNKFKQRQVQSEQPPNTNSLKNETSFWDTLRSYGNDANVLLGIIASLIAIGAAILAFYKRRRRNP